MRLLVLITIALGLSYPASADIVINEILPNPAGDDVGTERLEIYNNGGSAVDVTGWVVAANDALHTIHQRVDSAGRGTALRATLESFAVGAGVYEMLFRGAGPQADGSFTPSTVVENVGAVAGGDSEHYLKEKLHEYVSFALFSAGTILGSEAESLLSHELESLLGTLQARG